LSYDLLLNAVAAGLLLGGFYAAVSLGISVAFGLLDVVNIAHPVFVILGAYAAYVMNARFGWDPVLTGLVFTPVFYLLGMAVYRVYYASFERKGEEALRGLVFFFGIMFIVEVLLILVYGVDYRLVEAPYIGESFHLGPVSIAYRLFVPFLGGVLLAGGVYLFLGNTFFGRAIQGVSQDSLALRLMGADPIKIKTIAFGIAIATASLAGCLLIIIGPVEPSIGREYIGRVFAIAVLGGMGSIGGTLPGGLLLGLSEGIGGAFVGTGFRDMVGYLIFLLVLLVRPRGLFGRVGSE